MSRMSGETFSLAIDAGEMFSSALATYGGGGAVGTMARGCGGRMIGVRLSSYVGGYPVCARVITLSILMRPVDGS